MGAGGSVAFESPAGGGRRLSITATPDEELIDRFAKILSEASRRRGIEATCALLEQIKVKAWGQVKSKLTSTSVVDLLAVISEKSDDPDVVHEGFEALCNLADGSSESSVGANKSSMNALSIIAVGGIVEILAAMEKHRANPSIQKTGSALLCNLSFENDHGKAAIVRARGLTIICEGIVAHSNVEKVAEYGLAAICNIIAGSIKSDDSEVIEKIAKAALNVKVTFPESAAAENASDLLDMLQMS